MSTEKLDVEGGEFEGMSAWDKFLRFFLRNKIIVFIIMTLLLLGGLAVQPFDWNVADIPRDRVAVDAIPDVGENQQIVFTRWEGRSPRDIEDQITYPLTTNLLGLPGVKTVRSSSMLGFSSIYVIFEEGVDFYWARSRILEKLNSLPPGTLPEGVSPSLGPDATALGQVFWYTLEGRDKNGDPTGGWDLHELRSIQDWTVRYSLQSASGVSEVASIGGFQKEYQIDVDPDALAAYNVQLGQVADAVRQANLDVGARTMEINRIEYLIRGVGLVEGIEDLESTVVVARDEKPIRIRDIGRVTIGPKSRRGALDYEGAEAVGGVVVARYGENPVEVVENVKAKISEISEGLPKRTLDDGTVSQVEIVPFYDRSEVVEATLSTLSDALIQQILITIIVVLLLLGHLRSSAVISALLPLAVLMTFVAMKIFGVTANIMSLAGIAIAIGTMVDMAIVLTENMVERLEEAGPDDDRVALIREGAAEVAPAVLTSVLTTVVSFLPVFALTASEGKLFRPLAYTKTFALIASFGLAVVVLPTLVHLIVWPKIYPIDSRDSWWKTLVSGVFRVEHIRDWLLVALGIGVAVYGQVLLGLFFALIGVLRMTRSLFSEKWARVIPWIQNSVAAVGVTFLLTSAWMPLGFDEPLVLNLVFVAVITYTVLALFWAFIQVYDKLLMWTLAHKALFLTVPLILLVFGTTAWLGFDKMFGWLPQSFRMNDRVVEVAHAFPGFGREFMPPFDEGQFLYMPTTMPHASFGESLDQLKLMDAKIAQVPEVEEVVGKLGRVDSALDPAPASMFETIITYKPEWKVNEDGERVRQWRDHIKTTDDIWQEIVDAAQQPGLTSAPKLMPINTRIVMLQSGMRAPMGVKVKGPDLETIEEVGMRLEELLKQVPSIKSNTVVAERVVGKPYLEIHIDREAIGRHGLTIAKVQDAISIGLGGQALTQTIEGRERYPVRVRYMREERDSPEALRRMMVPTPKGEEVPLEQLAEIRYVRGPQVVKAEDTFLTSYVTFDKQPDSAEADAVEQAKSLIERKIEAGEFEVPKGVSYTFSGSYKNQLRSEARLRVLIPIALAVIFLILYLQFRRSSTAFIIYSAVIVAISGGFILIWFYNQPWFLDFEVFDRSMRDLFQVGPMNISVAVWVGFIALVGIATDDGVVMTTYLRQRFDAAPPKSLEEVREHVLEAGKRRVRPCLMTTATTLLALLPVISSQGRGADVMVPMAIPAVGGMAIELITLFVVPVLYSLREEWRFHLKDDQDAEEAD
ncbi:MAG: efflux RND transporter permease subunit [Myxococcota bacterium]